MVSAPKQSNCNRCGTCCKKGGPCFHIEDKNLIEKGIILSKYIYTIREGEPVFDNVQGRFLTATTDIIKIKGGKHSWMCIFFNEDDNNCKIYKNRPIECRALKCWDTEELERIYSKNRLTRKDLLSKINGLWNLIEDHQARCSYKKVSGFVSQLNCDKKNKAVEDILDIIRYDIHLRPLLAEKAGINPDMIDFMFGRPLTETIKMYNLQVKHKDNRYYLKSLNISSKL
ncbi:MAG TPA: YkgJ family cysteine cluster protein [Anaerolineae bacterium]|nr:YkgJ family cysteine cluster protein [Anaerolineae bacterium]